MVGARRAVTNMAGEAMANGREMRAAADEATTNG
jgi:hypothetical protein